MNSSSLSFVLLLIGLVYQCESESQSQSQSQPQTQTLWQKFKSNYWAQKDELSCYRISTLKLLENLKQIVDKYYVEMGEKEFKSKVASRRKLFSFFSSNNGSNGDSFDKRKKEAEKIGSEALSRIRQWLIHHCTDEKQKKVMEFTKTFQNDLTECKDQDYLKISIMLLEQACPEEGKDGIANGKPTFAYKKAGIHGLYDPWNNI